MQERWSKNVKARSICMVAFPYEKTNTFEHFLFSSYIRGATEDQGRAKRKAKRAREGLPRRVWTISSGSIWTWFGLYFVPQHRQDNFEIEFSPRIAFEAVCGKTASSNDILWTFLQASRSCLSCPSLAPRTSWHPNLSAIRHMQPNLRALLWTCVLRAKQLMHIAMYVVMCVRL